MSSYLALESSLRSPLYRKIANRPSCADPFLETSELNQCESTREYREITPITAVQAGGDQIVTFRLPRGNLFLTDMVLRVDHGALTTGSGETLELRTGAGYNCWERVTIEVGNTVLATCFSDYAAQWIRGGAYPEEQIRALETMSGFADQTERQSRVTAGSLFAMLPFWFNSNQTALDLWATNAEINVNVHMRSSNSIVDTGDGGSSFTAVKLLCNLHTVPEKVRNRHDQLAYSANKSSISWDQGRFEKSLGVVDLRSTAQTVTVELNGISGLVNTAYFYVVPTSHLTNRNSTATSSPYHALEINGWKFQSLGNTLMEKFSDNATKEGTDMNKLYHILSRAPGCPKNRSDTAADGDLVENVQQLTTANSPFFRRGNTGAYSFEYLSTPSLELTIPAQESSNVDLTLVFLTEQRVLMDQLVVAGTARKIHYRKITQ